MKKITILLLIYSLLLCACNGQTTELPPAPDSGGSLIIAASPTAVPTLITTSTPTPNIDAPTTEVAEISTPTPTRSGRFDGWDVKDNGVDGVGVWRGNTNGNLATGGRAVETTDTIYYIANPSGRGEDNMSLMAYSKATKKKKTLLEDEAFLGDLNWDGRLLWFTKSHNYWNLPSEVCTLDPNTGEMEIVYEYDTNRRLNDLMIAYDLVLIVDWISASSEPYEAGESSPNRPRFGTVCLDVNTREEIYRHPNFFVTSAMDGWLYGYAEGFGEPVASSKFYKMRPDGTQKNKCAPVSVAANGKLYFYELFGNNMEDGLRKLMITDVESGITQEIEMPDLVFNNYFNVRDLIYLQDYETGELYTMNLSGTNLTRIPGQVFYWKFGPTVLSSGLANLIVPCDPPKK